MQQSTSLETVDDILNFLEEKTQSDTVPSGKASHKPRVVFVLGGPGAGKGTQCQKLMEEFPIIHLSAGDLLREEKNSNSKDAELINNYIKEGKIVPVEITVGLIKKAMQANMEKGKFTFVIDGFPRNHDNLSGWNKVMEGFAEVPFLLYLKCTEEEMEQRILTRAKTSSTVRVDDNIESIKKRFQVFNKETMPIIELFQKDHTCHTVNSIGKVDAIYAKVRALFVPLLTNS